MPRTLIVAGALGLALLARLEKNAAYEHDVFDECEEGAMCWDADVDIIGTCPIAFTDDHRQLFRDIS